MVTTSRAPGRYGAVSQTVVSLPDGRISLAHQASGIVAATLLLEFSPRDDGIAFTNNGGAGPKESVAEEVKRVNKPIVI